MLQLAGARCCRARTDLRADELSTRWLLPCDVRDFAAMHDFQNVVYDLWFAPYRRITNNDSSGFEHVFVGEEKDGAERKKTPFWRAVV